MNFQTLTELLPGGLGVVLATAVMVTLAEMADKTQILTLALTTKYKTRFVWIGIFLGSILSHGVAVAAGQLFQRFMQGLSDWMPLIAGVLFILFAFWGLFEKEEETDEPRLGKSAFGPILTIAGTFFVAELGDKTQLMSLTLSASIPNTALFVLIGAVIGMMLANGLAILVGVFLGKKLPEELLKWLSSILFFVFGILGAFESLLQLIGHVWTFVVIAVLVVAFVAIGISRRKRV